MATMNRWWIAALATSTLAQTQPLAQWNFDKDSPSDRVSGLYRLVRAMVGGSLQFDGYTTHILQPAQQVRAITGGFTIEAWLALNAYPWNWVPIVDCQRDMQAGYLFGIDAYGRLGMHAAIGGSWHVVSSAAKIPLKRWTHVAASFDPGRGIALYVDGKPVGELAAAGALSAPERTDLLIGRVGSPMLPVPSGLIHPNMRSTTRSKAAR